MSALVGYGSSSEDDDDDETRVSQPRNLAGDVGDSLTNGNASKVSRAHGSNGELETSSQGPMVGPNRPILQSASEQYEDGDNDAQQDIPPMSQTDMLRYLTQPSHPMTSLPPEPSSEADTAVSAKFRRFLELKSKGIHFNEDLASKSSFKNPSLFSSLLDRASLPPEAQYASTLPSDVFNLGMLPPWAYKEELLKSQQASNAELETAKKAKSAAGKRKIEFTSAREN